MISVVFFQLQEKYTIGGHTFGMGRGVIRFTVDSCQDCIMEMALSKKSEDQNGITSSLHVCNGRLGQESCSMVAQMPNTACIWFDKSGKLLLILFLQIDCHCSNLPKGGGGCREPSNTEIPS